MKIQRLIKLLNKVSVNGGILNSYNLIYIMPHLTVTEETLHNSCLITCKYFFHVIQCWCSSAEIDEKYGKIVEIQPEFLCMELQEACRRIWGHPNEKLSAENEERATSKGTLSKKHIQLSRQNALSQVDCSCLLVCRPYNAPKQL